MPTRLSRRCVVAVLSAGLLYAAVRTTAADPPADPKFTPEQLAFYEKDVLDELPDPKPSVDEARSIIRVLVERGRARPNVDGGGGWYPA